MQYFVVNESNRGKANMRVHEGKEFIGSGKFSAVNKSDCGKVSMTGHDGKEVTSSV